jgi:L-lactate dehydrogenase
MSAGSDGHHTKIAAGVVPRAQPEEDALKLGIIGVGAVGAATAMAVAMRARIRQLVLLDRDRARAKAIATDMQYGVPLSPLIDIRDGDYDDLADAGLLLVTAGINEKTGGATDRNDPAGRLRLLDANVKVYEDIVPRLVRVAPAVPILVVTDPPEPLIDITRGLAGHDRVLGTSTYLDSLRFRVHLARRLGVSPSCVDAYVVGEHGTSSVFLWSSARIGGARVRELLEKKGIDFDTFRLDVEQEVRFANITIIEGTGASQYGVGMVAARVAEAVLRDERAVFAAGFHSDRYGVAVSLPAVVGRQGVSQVIWPEMSAEEAQALERSVAAIKSAVGKYLGKH